MPVSAVLSARLVERLADGRAYTRTALADASGLSLDELPRQLDALADAGLEVREAADGKVSLAQAIRWIDREAVTGALDAKAHQHIERIDCLFEHASTNRYLLDAGAPPLGLTRVAIAEYQHAGRGRRGRRWIMPPGTGIALSAAWQFAGAPNALSAFSLAVGAAARRAILDVTGLAVGLKWPNDLYHAGGKLGGILVELDPLPGGATHVIAGVGINVDLPKKQRVAVSDLPDGARDLAGTIGATAPDRSLLAGALTGRLIELFTGYGETGFEPYRAEWSAAHVLDGESVALHLTGGIDFGIVRGIESDGALIVEDDSGRRRRHTAGDVTVRRQA